MAQRASLLTKKRCYNHPHRETELLCERCKTAYCAECLVEDEGKKVCEPCRLELIAARDAILTPKEKAVAGLRSLVRGLIVAGVIVAVAVGFFFLYRDNFERPLTPEELARFRYAMTGSFQTEEGVNASSTVLGAKLTSATSQAEGYPATSLINEYTGAGAPPWRSTDATFPQEIVVKFDSVSSVSKVNLTNSPSQPVETYVKDFEVLLSLGGPEAEFTSLGRFVAEPIAELQRFTFAETQSTYVKLRILSNYGSPDYTSLDEFNAFVIPEASLFGASGTPGATPSATPAPGTPGSR